MYRVATPDSATRKAGRRGQAACASSAARRPLPNSIRKRKPWQLRRVETFSGPPMIDDIADQLQE